MIDSRLELFYNCVRELNIPQLYSYLKNSYKEEPDDTFIIAMYIRDCREGLGERLLGRKALGWLLLKDPVRFDRIIPWIPEYGRWDDLLYFWPGVLYPEKNSIKYIKKNFNIKVDEEKLNKIKEVQIKTVMIIAGQLANDVESMNKNQMISLCAKWAPSENCSLDRDKKVVNTLCKIMEWTKKEYRQKYLSPLRSYGKVLERLLCDNNLEDINMDLVSSRAMIKYRNTFIGKIPDKYYSRKIIFDYHKIYPHDIIFELRKKGFSKLIKEKWKNMKIDYDDVHKNFLCILDNSPSINSWKNPSLSDILPSDVIYSLGLFFPSLLSSPYKNNIIPLHHEPKIFKITGKTLGDKYTFIKDLPWGMQITLEKIYTLIIKKRNIVEIPDVLIVSDKSIEKAIPDFKETFKIEETYKKQNFNLPNILFWNLNGNSGYPTVKNYKNIQIINGYSLHVLDCVITNKKYDPNRIMENKIHNARYKKILNSSFYDLKQ